MKIKISLKNCIKMLPCLLCMTYYCTYMLWDSKTRIIKYIILALLLIGIFIELAKFFQNRRPSIHDNILIFLFVLLEGIFFIYAIAAEERLQKNVALYQYNFYIFLLCAAIFYVDKKYFYKILGILRYLGCLLSLFAIYEFITRAYIIPADNEWYGRIYFGGVWLIRSRVFSDSPMVFGLIMALLTIISFDYYHRSKNIINLVITIMNLVGVALSASRGPYVSLAVGVFFYYLFDERTNKKKLIKIGIEIIALIIFFVLLINILSETNSTIAYIYARITSIFEWSGSNNENWSANTTRLGLWENAVNILFTGTNWIHGIGAAATGARSLDINGFVTESGVLRRLVEFGIFIAFLYYIFLFRLIKYGYKKAKKNKSQNIALAIALIVCILVEDTILQITEEISISFFLWLFIAFLVKDGNLSVQKK